MDLEQNISLQTLPPTPKRPAITTTTVTKMSDFEDDGILNIQVSDAEDTPAEKKAKRTGQSEAEFQAVRATYVTKVQNGNVSAYSPRLVCFFSPFSFKKKKNLFADLGKTYA